ncbi:type I restriction-modification enzyme R subunit C-terminal domain-containing protein, partial [Ruminococcus sp.]|uniref:type I restriction-modification enzyme R subunit C-terminal domain-containing protein n=1 Tax=Ruminococcus sp. TaxID=41978 RepID=UPI00257E0BDF
HENIIDYTKTNILGEFADLEHFIRSWNSEEKKRTISELFKEHGIDIQALKESQGMCDIDDFDFIIHIAFDKKPLTRKERANDVKKRDFISKYNGLAKEVLEALLDMYSNEGIYQIEDTQVLKLDPFIRMGKPAAIVKLFGGKEGYKKAVKELEEEIYKVV